LGDGNTLQEADVLLEGFLYDILNCHYANIRSCQSNIRRVDDATMSGVTGKLNEPIKLPLKDSEVRYRRLFEAAQDGILLLDAKTGMITDVNPFLINLLGYSREEFIEKSIWEVGAFQDIKANKGAFKSLQANEYIRYKDLPLKAKDGRLVPVEFVSNVYWEGKQKVIQCNIRDISERKQDQYVLLKEAALLREESIKDHLTGLFNRRYLEETLERELLRALRNQLPLGIIMLDIDDFKHFNDTRGHAAGDAILREFAKLMIGHIRGEDIACRYGGDEFIIVLPGASRRMTRERAKQLLDYAKHLFVQLEGKPLGPVSLSVGVAVFPEDGSTRTAILKVVDTALYRAKHEKHSRLPVPEEPSDD
jgi:diguanylate cyclase (GGDEF)-like protein/PAS domain S-box-containing protein